MMGGDAVPSCEPEPRVMFTVLFSDLPTALIPDHHARCRATVEVIMPYLVLAVALLVLSGPIDSGSFAASSRPALAHAAHGELLLAFDDEAYGDRNDDESVDPDNYGSGYGDDEDDDQDDSARNHEDDDDGWDIDEYERSERA
jgi:hypothetical protein